MLRRTGVPASEVDYVCAGQHIQELRTANVAREAALGVGLRDITPAHTVSMACVSSLQAVTTCLGAMRSDPDNVRVCLAGGVEYMTDVPVGISRCEVS